MTVTTPRRGRSRARWVAVLCGAGTLAVGVVAVPHAIRHVRESRAIVALLSDDAGERASAIRELARLGSPRAVLGILAAMRLPAEDASSVVENELWMRFEEGSRFFMGLCEDVCGPGIAAIGSRAVDPLRSRLGSSKTAERYWSLHFLWRLPELSRPGPGPALRSLLDDPDNRVRREAVSAMAFSAATSPTVFDDLLLDLKSAASSERERAAVAETIALATLVALREKPFGWQDGHAPPVGGLETRHAMARAASLALLAGVEDPSVSVRRECIRGLHVIERRWASYVPGVRGLDGLDLRAAIRVILRRWLEGEDDASRSVSLEWLSPWILNGHGEALSPDVVRIISRHISDPDVGIRLLAGERLVCIEAIPVLIGVLGEGESITQLRARGIIERIVEQFGPERTWKAIFALLGSSDDWLLADLLSSVGEKDGTGIDRLVEALASTKPEIRAMASEVLARYAVIGSFDDDGLLVLLESGEELRRSAVDALAWSRKLAVPTRDGVSRALMVSGSAAALWRAACRAAKDLGPEAKEVVPQLVSLLETRPWAGQESAAEALGAMGSAALAAVPVLLAATESADPQLSAKALDALSRITPEAAVPAAIRALEHDSDRVRDAALTALWALGPEAVPALPALRKLAGDPKNLAAANRAARLVRLLEPRGDAQSAEVR